MKIKKTILFCLSLALAAGAAACVSFVSAKAPVEAKAAGETKTVYLELNDFRSWDGDNAKFSVYLMPQGGTAYFPSSFMTPVSGFQHMYEFEIDSSVNDVIFVRHDSAAVTPSWANKWNQTADISLGDKNCCVIEGWGDPNCPSHLTKLTPVDDGCYLVGSHNSWTADSTSKMSYDSTKAEYSSEVELEKGDVFKVVSYSRFAGTYYGWEVLESGDGSARNAGQIIAADSSEKPDMKVDVAGSYTPYFKTGSSTIWISAIEISHVYTLVVGGDDVALVQNPGNPNEYMTSEPISLESGNVVSYECDGAAVSGQTAKSIGNNNLWNDNGTLKVCLDITANVYVDVINKTIFCSGLDVNKFYMSVNDVPHALTHNENPADPSFNEYYIEGYSFEHGDVIKFVDTKDTNSNAVVFSVLNINEYSKGGFSVIDNELVCSEPLGTMTNLYVKFKSGADEVYFGDVSEDLAAAIDYAEQFNDMTDDVCVGYGETVVGDLQAGWSAMAVIYDDVLASGKLILQGADESHSNPAIAAFAHQYDYIIAHYSAELAAHGGNFVSRTPVSVAINNHQVFNVSNESSIAIVVIVSVVAVTSIAAFFVIKRRKEN